MRRIVAAEARAEGQRREFAQASENLISLVVVESNEFEECASRDIAARSRV